MTILDIKLVDYNIELVDFGQIKQIQSKQINQLKPSY